jgi:ferritin-like metal-binding protein YciE
MRKGLMALYLQLQEADFTFKTPKRKMTMAIKDPKELFVRMLSAASKGTERSIEIFQEMSQAVQDPGVKEALDARAFAAKSDLAKLEQCFRLLGEKPVELTGRIQEIFAEDFRKELTEIQSPAAKLLFVLAKANHLTHFRIAGYESMIAIADRTGHYGVGVLLESCLADKIAFVERNRRFIRKYVESKVSEKLAA